MSEPIKIVLTAETAEAAAKLQAFCQSNAIAFKSLAAAGHQAEGALTANRLAIMEMGHSARSMADGLAAGMSPLRLMAMEAPRLMQAGAMMTEELKTKLLGYLPVVGAVAAAVGAGYLAWELFTADERKAAEEAQKLAEALDKIPAILEKIHALGKAGLMSEAAQKEFADYLGKNPKKKLFVSSSGDLTESSTEVQNVQINNPFGMAGSYTAQRLVNLPQATPDQVNDWEAKQMPQVSENQLKAKDKLNELTTRARNDLLTGLEKEKAEIHERYAKERDELELTLKQSGELVSQRQQTDTAELIKQSQIAEDRAKVAAEYRYEQASIKKAAQELAQSRADAAKETKNKLDEVEAGISTRANQEGVLRGQYAEQEYRERYDGLAAAYEAGGLTEGEYTQKLAAAWKDRVQGVHEYQAALEKTAALQQEIARSKIEAQLRDIHGDQFSTQSEKDAQSIPLYQQLMAANQKRIGTLTNTAATTTDDSARLEAEKQITGLMSQQAELADKINEAQKTQSATMAFGAMFAELSAKAEITFNTLASAFQNVFNGAVQAISHGITGLIEGTMTWGQALRSIANSILNEIISAIVQMGVRWLLTQAIMAMGGRAIAAAAMAASAPIAAAQAVIWTPAAVMATIGTLGAAAVAAPGFIGGAEAMSLGLAAFADGGRPTPGNLALVGERGPELFIPDTAGTIIPADQTARMLNAALRPLAGSGAATTPGASPGGNKVSVYSFVDKTEMQNHLEQNEDHEKWVIGVVGKQAHKFA